MNITLLVSHAGVSGAHLASTDLMPLIDQSGTMGGEIMNDGAYGTC